MTERLSKRAAHDPAQVALVAATLLAGHKEPQFACSDPEVVKTVTEGARLLLDEAALPRPPSKEEAATWAAEDAAEEEKAAAAAKAKAAKVDADAAAAKPVKPPAASSAKT